jgi:hypothetical protein
MIQVTLQNVHIKAIFFLNRSKTFNGLKRLTMVNTYTDICRVEDRILAGALLFSHRNGHEDFFHRYPNGHSEPNFLCSPRRK